jgi:hypothetical protein
MKRPAVDVLSVLPKDARPSPAEVEALLEIAYFTTAANGDLSDEECDAYRAAAPRLRAMAGAAERGPLSDRELSAEFDGFEQRLRHSNVEARLFALAGTLVSPPARRRAYALSYAFSLCDWETNEDEIRFLAQLARALGIESETAALEENARAALKM